MMFHALRQAQAAIAEGTSATHRSGQQFRNLGGGEAVAVTHHCVYCYTSMERQRVRGLRGAVGATRDRRVQYVQYLISTPVNYTCTHLADHLEGTSHDAINDYLRRGKVTSSVQDKNSNSMIKRGLS